MPDVVFVCAVKRGKKGGVEIWFTTKDSLCVYMIFLHVAIIRTLGNHILSLSYRLHEIACCLQRDLTVREGWDSSLK